jgi:tryptophan synthase beta chain
MQTLDVKAERIVLPQDDIPRYWHNLLPELPEPLPDPIPEVGGTPSRKRVMDMMEGVWAKEHIRQEYSDEGQIKIPDEVINYYLHIGRPTPLHRARRLEEYLKTSARIYFKREDTLPTGSFKINTVISQIHYAMKEGFDIMADGTGAGQTGCAVAAVSATMGVKAKIFMVRSSYLQKPLRVAWMKMCGADIKPSPSNETELGRSYLKKNPEDPGSLGVTTVETMDWAKANKAFGLQGSIFNYVMTQQSIMGLEAKKQLELAGEKPDVLIGCVGAGSNFMGFSIPFISDKLKGKTSCRIVDVRPDECAPEVYGEYRYDLLSPGTKGPLYKMYTLGNEFSIPGLVSEGLRFHGVAPMLSLLINKKIVEATSVKEKDVMEAGRLCLEKENFLPAPESAHAIKIAVDEALKAKQKNEKKVIVAHISGGGFLDIGGYSKVLNL